jgi:predicted CoA-substrate-specific enzyme activase
MNNFKVMSGGIRLYSLGMDIGYSSIKISLMNSDNEIECNKYILHKGRIKEVLKNTIEELLNNYNLEDIKFGAVTGSGSKFMVQTGKANFVNEVTAIVEGSINENRSIGSIIEIGGQSAKYITDFRKDDKSKIKISMNSNCSAGTGSFLEEQMSRLNLSLEDYSIYASKAKSIPRIAGRCSVFAKTDITHHYQEGVSTPDILLGLAYAVIRNYKGTVMKKLPMKKPVLFVGGVTHNQGIITALKDVLKLDDGELIVSKYLGNVAASGAAVIAKNENMKMDLGEILISLKEIEVYDEKDEDDISLPRLISYGKNDSLNKHICKPINNDKGRVDCYIGVDIGSTSTNLVLMNKDNEIIAYRYLKTLGNPIEAVRLGLKELDEELGDKVNIVGACTTGSGRYMIAKLIGADIIKDEITAQAKAAITIDSSVDTIFEIGGQDSKYISLKDGVVTDFQMNKICAAGTGSFIEEQAKKFNIPINDFGDITLNSDNPIRLGERCTVFIETSIAANLAKGAKIDDIASGLCYSIVKNYLDRVVGQKKIGNKIFFQGGVAYNQGVINAFRALVGDKLFIPPFFSITGAYGAAILAKEEMGLKKTLFKGFNIETKEEFIEKQSKIKSEIDNKTKFSKEVEEIVFKEYEGTIDNTKKTVGIPRSLFVFGMFPMFNAFFKELGLNVLLSDPTNEKIISLGQQYSLDEACYPVKLINGHVADLVEKKVDYIFFPDLYTVDHPGSMSRQNYGCAYMQLAFKVVNRAMELESKGIKLLSPSIAFSFGKDYMMESFRGLGVDLGKTQQEIGKALQKGMQAILDFEERIEENGRKVIKGLRPDEKVFVLISKMYGVADPVLNMGIPDKLMNMGYQVIPFYNMPEGDISKEYPNMYWPFMQHVLEPIQLVKQHPNLYAIYLSHHGCGPDSVTSHYIRQEMDGKPYLHIEVDEHSSPVGVITRVEAFVNSLNSLEVEKADDMEAYLDRIDHKEVNIKNNLNELKADTKLYLPNIYPYSKVIKEILIKQGINTEILPGTNRTSAELGRRHSTTEEYFSLTALLGDVLKELEKSQSNEENIALLIPRTEGAEVEGQYNRFLRTKLDEEGFKNVDILAPFMEDFLYKDDGYVESMCLGLLAGDIIRIADKKYRKKHLESILNLIRNNNFEINSLKEIGKEVYKELKTINKKKRVLAIGEVMVLYNDFMNDFTLSNLEDKDYRVVYSPFSEYLWLLWRDFGNQNKNEKTDRLLQKLDQFKDYINSISECLVDESPFEKELENLANIADETIGYYAGANGRYREAKVLGELDKIDGIITLASMYENTGIALNILHKGFEKANSKPILNLTFDGNKNENDETKIESFMYYI